jgi:hypothetical protein
VLTFLGFHIILGATCFIPSDGWGIDLQLRKSMKLNLIKKLVVMETLWQIHQKMCAKMNKYFIYLETNFNFLNLLFFQS